jgi:hypothetical protein
MVKNIILYIFIYVLCVGCESNIYGTHNHKCPEDGCFLELNIDGIDEDTNGYYHLNWNDGVVQTFTKIEAYVGHSYQFVGWTSNTYFNGCTWGYCEPVNVVNSSSYSDTDGMAYTMMGVYESNIGDTAVVYCGYYYMEHQYLDSIRIIINE